MRRQGVLWDLHFTRNVTDGHAFGSALNEEAKNLETAVLSERRQSCERASCIHVSRYIESLEFGQMVRIRSFDRTTKEAVRHRLSP